MIYCGSEVTILQKKEWIVFMNAMTILHYLLKVRASLQFYIIQVWKRKRKSIPEHIKASNWGIWEKYLARFFSFFLFKHLLYFSSVWY